MKVWLGWLLRRDESQRAKPAKAKGQTHAVQCGEMSFLSTHYIKWHAPLPPVNWEPSILWDVCIPLSLNALYLASLQQQEAYWYALWLRCPRPHFRTAPLTLIMVSKALGKSYRSYSEAVYMPSSRNDTLLTLGQPDVQMEWEAEHRFQWCITEVLSKSHQ